MQFGLAYDSARSMTSPQIGMLVIAAPLLTGETLSQHELASDKVVPERTYSYRNALDFRLLAHVPRSFPRLSSGYANLICQSGSVETTRRDRGALGGEAVVHRPDGS